MNNYPIATILGGGGFIGRYLVRNLTKKNYRCIIPTRNPFTKVYLKTQAPPGAIEIIKFGQNNFEEINLKAISLDFGLVASGLHLFVSSLTELTSMTR